MATPTLKTTYSLDLETVRTLEALAQRWRVSKSEALRRAIRAAAGGPALGSEAPLKALDALQRSLGLTPAAALAWERRARAERRASSRHSLGRGR
jgi:hypothetical protein